jgi:DNA-binding beta-propeller fold protein YncE
MSRSLRTILALAVPVALVAGLTGWQASAQQPSAQPTNDVPNPYATVENYFKMPAGRTWGSTSAVDIAPDGKSIWVAERCGANSCLDRATGQMSSLPVILRFDLNGNLMTSFGAGMFIFPHGIHVDREGNVWVTDGQDNAPAPARGAAPAGAAAGGAAAGGGRQGGGAAGGGRGPAQPPRPNPAATKGHQVMKFSPDGKLLMTLGKPAGATDPDYFFQPNDVITNQKGEIFIAEGHSSAPGAQARILKFTPDGKLIKVIGKRGTGPGEFDQPHALAFDSQGRLFVGDRGNNRVQIIDQEGNFIADWPQFSRPSGLFIDRNDMLYSADSESGSVNPAHGAWKRGIRIGSVKDGKVIALIPDPDEKGTGTLAAEGVAVDPQGNIYGAEVGPRALKKYVRK